MLFVQKELCPSLVEGYTEDMKKSGKDLLLQHLLLTHSFVIADVQLIADFPQYVR